MTNERKKLIKKCDGLWAEIVKKKARYKCQRCGSKSKQLNACHFISRSNKVLRWEITNGVCLDVGDHFYFHKNPEEFTEWFKKLLGEKDFEILMIKKHNKLKTSVANLTLVRLYLEQEMKKLEG